MPTKYPLREDPSCSMVKWKRINSQKIEFATHNSFEKGLKESIAQPSTPEVLAMPVDSLSVSVDIQKIFNKYYLPSVVFVVHDTRWCILQTQYLTSTSVRLASHFGDADAEGGDGRFGVVGLHTCGDLGALLVKLFAESGRAAYLQGRAQGNLDSCIHEN